MITKKIYGLETLGKRLGPMTMADFLRSWRLSEEMSQREFAKLLKMLPANLCDIEKGRKGVSPEKAEQIAKILGYSETVLVKIALQEQLKAAGLNYRIEVKPAAS